MDIRQCENYVKYMRSLGWLVEKTGKAKVFIRHLPLIPYFSVIKVQRPESIDLKKVDDLAKTHHALFVKFEPDTDLRNLSNLGYLRDDWPLLPTKTLVIDLQKTTIESLPKDTRYEIRRAKKNNLQLSQGESLQASLIQSFYSLLQETMKIGRWSIPIKKEVTNLWKSFQPNNSALIFCSELRTPNSEPVAGCLLIWDGNTAHYMYAALTSEGRKLSAAYFLLWEAIKSCQKKGLKYLDLEGIYDERYSNRNKDWQGFSKFKMGWGGKTVEYPGSYTKYYNPLVKILFSVF